MNWLLSTGTLSDNIDASAWAVVLNEKSQDIRKSLHEFRQTWKEPVERTLQWNELRNKLVHGDIDAARIAKAKEIAETNGQIWSASFPHILDHPKLKEAFAQLGAPDFSGKYTALVQQLCALIKVGK